MGNSTFIYQAYFTVFFFFVVFLHVALHAQLLFRGARVYTKWNTREKRKAKRRKKKQQRWNILLIHSRQEIPPLALFHKIFSSPLPRARALSTSPCFLYLYSILSYIFFNISHILYTRANIMPSRVWIYEKKRRRNFCCLCWADIERYKTQKLFNE